MSEGLTGYILLWRDVAKLFLIALRVESVIAPVELKVISNVTAQAVVVVVGPAVFEQKIRLW